MPASRLGVVVAALLILPTGWLWLDPALGLVIALVILVGTWGLLRESIDLAMDAVPRGIDPPRCGGFLAAQPGVAEVHDLHIWAMGTTETALTAHLVRPGAAPDDAFLATLAAKLAARFGIGHATLQVEGRRPGASLRPGPGGKAVTGRHNPAPPPAFGGGIERSPKCAHSSGTARKTSAATPSPIPRSSIRATPSSRSPAARSAAPTCISYTTSCPA